MACVGVEVERELHYHSAKRCFVRKFGSCVHRYEQSVWKEERNHVSVLLNQFSDWGASSSSLTVVALKTSCLYCVFYRCSRLLYLLSCLSYIRISKICLSFFIGCHITRLVLLIRCRTLMSTLELISTLSLLILFPTWTSHAVVFLYVSGLDRSGMVIAGAWGSWILMRLYLLPLSNLTSTVCMGLRYENWLIWQCC